MCAPAVEALDTAMAMMAANAARRMVGMPPSLALHGTRSNRGLARSHVATNGIGLVEATIEREIGLLDELALRSFAGPIPSRQTRRYRSHSTQNSTGNGPS
jgi:hypothetical protein